MISDVKHLVCLLAISMSFWESIYSDLLLNLNWIVHCLIWASLVAQSVKNRPAMQETWVQFLGWEDSLEQEMVTYSSILTWRIPWTEKPGMLQSVGSQELDRT